MLLWKRNNYYIFRVCVCILTLVIRYGNRMRYCMLLSVACRTLTYFAQVISIMGRFKKKIEPKIYILIFSSTFFLNISHSKKNSPRYYQNVRRFACKVSLLLSDFNDQEQGKDGTSSVLILLASCQQTCMTYTIAMCVCVCVQ